MSSLREEITKRFLRTRPQAAAHRPPSEEQETSVPSDPREGKQFGIYRILRSLGAGGMGHVYLALDTRLGRHTALKFLSHDLFANQEMLERLEYEARTASALNHPNILTIYEIGEHEGDLFVASEFIEGITLRKAIERRLIDTRMAIGVARQVVSALMAAHAAGVVHRDLKPANIMIRPDGYIKIIDFGLAKVTGESSLGRLKNAGWTIPGAVMGTVDYMSPEQARGDEVDARSDLWTLGVVLFEMLSNQRPFDGETDSHVIVAILDRPAPPLPNVASLPRGIAQIVQRALMKDPARRYQSAQEMLADLERIDAPASRRRAAFFTASSRVRKFRFHRSAWAALFGFIAIAAASTWWWRFNGKEKFFEPDWFRVDSVRQLTFTGRTLESAISPDGKYLAFVAADPGGMQSLHLKQIDQPSDEVRIPSRAVEYIGLTFSPDSRTIYEVEREHGSKLGRLFTVPLVGDRASNPLVEDIDGPVTFSPSGDHFAFVRFNPLAPGARHGSSSIEIYDGPGRVAPLLTTPETLFRQLAWSGDGRNIAAITDDSSGNSDKLSLSLYHLNGGKSLRPLPDWKYAGRLAWAGSNGSIILTASAHGEAANRQQLRELSIETAKTNDITKDLAGYSDVTLTADGKRLAAIKHDARAYLWISDRRNWLHGTIAPAESQDTDSSLDWIDNGRIVLTSRRTGYPNLAVFDLANQKISEVTNEPSVEQQATVIPGTSLIVFSSNRSGGTHLWSYDTRSNRYTQLTFGNSYDDTPDALPDGRSIVYTAWSGRTPFLRKVNVSGGPSDPIGNYPAKTPQVSPDGKYVACNVQKDAAHWFVAVVPIDGRGEPRAIPGAGTPFRWAPQGNALVATLTDASGAANLWRIGLNGKPGEQLTTFEGDSILAFAWSPAGDRLACLRAALGSDAVLMTRK